MAISPDRDLEVVRRFGCLTADLREMGRWLVEKDVRGVALQSTWRGLDSLSKILERQGPEAVFGKCPAHQQRART